MVGYKYRLPTRQEGNLRKIPTPPQSNKNKQTPRYDAIIKYAPSWRDDSDSS